MTLTQIIKRIYKSSKQTVDACSMVHVLVAVFVRRHTINIDRFPNLISAVAAADTILVNKAEEQLSAHGEIISLHDLVTCFESLICYSSITSNIILAPSLKLFWNNRHSAMV